MFTSEETPKPLSDEEHSNDVMFYEDNTSVGAIPILTSIKSLQNPLSSKPIYDSLEEEAVNVDANTQGNQGIETKSNPAENTKIFKPWDDKKSESSTSDIGSSDENISNPFALLELWDNVAASVSKVDSLDKTIAQLDSKIDQKVTNLESKLELIFKSLSEIKDVGPSELDWANQFD